MLACCRQTTCARCQLRVEHHSHLLTPPIDHSVLELLLALGETIVCRRTELNLVSDTSLNSPQVGRNDEDLLETNKPRKVILSQVAESRSHAVDNLHDPRSAINAPTGVVSLVVEVAAHHSSFD